jgi:hypothetical protein
MAAGVSNQLIASCLALLGILGAALIFALDKRTFAGLSVILVGSSFLCLVLSVGAGAKGVATLYEAGHGGNWNYLLPDGWFQAQAVLAIVALVAFGAGVATMPGPKGADDGRKIQRTVDSLRAIVMHDSVRIARMESRLVVLDSVAVRTVAYLSELTPGSRKPPHCGVRGTVAAQICPSR